MRRVQDSVHGLMEFTGSSEILLDVLRTPELQRLRRIRQLGLAHLVFPAAEHSRLAHSIGAAYLAVRFGTRIQDVARTRLAPILCPTDEDIRPAQSHQRHPGSLQGRSLTARARADGVLAARSPGKSDGDGSGQGE